jgi:predicted nucleic acid-binding protein
MRVFLDASALVPMTVPRDQWRPRLNAEMAALHRGGVPDFVTTTWTLYEALSLAKRAGHARAVALWNLSKAFQAVATVTQAIEAEAVQRFLSWSDSGASVVDHANVLAAVDYRCDLILSFDDDFARLAGAAGIRLIGLPPQSRGQR